MGALQPLVAIVVSLAVAAGVAWAGSQGGARAGGAPLLALCAALSFAVNWAAFVPAYLARTERYFDLVGSLTHLALVACAVVLQGRGDPRALLLATLIGVWALRLGPFLFLRVLRAGADRRFDALKRDFGRFLMTWTLQGLWVFLTQACALTAISSATSRPLGWPALVGALVWGVGFAVEVVADRQKSAFRAVAENRDRFITTGLWAWSRHPNYLGEIALWCGVALVALPALSGLQLVTLISPAFVFLLLTRVSGIPLLEARAERRWGDDPEYRAYRERTPALWPRPPRPA